MNTDIKPAPNTETQPEIIWQGRRFFGIVKFDCHIVNLYNDPTLSGEYFTILPISSTEYRRENHTKAKVEVNVEDSLTVFLITDDWGEKRTMKIPNKMNKEIQAAIASAVKKELLILPKTEVIKEQKPVEA